MTKAVVIPFFRYQPHVGLHYKIYFDWLIEALKIWGDEFDTLYLLDQDMKFTGEDLERIRAVKPQTEIIESTATGHHWVQFKNALPKVKEDVMLCLDNDVLIWRKGVVAKWLEQAQDCDLVTNFDGSGGLQSQVRKRFPVLDQYQANRMGSYYFVIRKDFLAKIPDFDFAPITYTPGTYIPQLNYTTKENDWSDSFGLFTIKALALDPKLGWIEDDRSSLYLEVESLLTKDPLEPRQLGYYHVRNGNLPIYTLASKMHNYEDYLHVNTITPFREHMRLFAWFWILCDYLGKEQFKPEMIDFLKDRGVIDKEWLKYVDKVKDYHGFLI